LFIKENYEVFGEWYKQDKMNLFLIEDFEEYELKLKNLIKIKKETLINNSLIPSYLREDVL